jgi:hypothetical protein
MYELEDICWVTHHMLLPGTTASMAEREAGITHILVILPERRYMRYGTSMCILGCSHCYMAYVRNQKSQDGTLVILTTTYM